MGTLSNSSYPSASTATTARLIHPTSTTTSTQNSLLPQASDPPRLRQGFPIPMSPYSYTDDVKDTQLVSPNYEGSNGPSTSSSVGYQYLAPSQMNNPYRPRSPLSQQPPYEDPTLSRFLQHVFVTAKSAFNGRSSTQSNNNSFLTPSSSEISLPYLSSLLPTAPSPSPSPISTGRSPSWFKLADSSTVGFVTLCGLWYMTSALSSNTGKVILTRFRYPVTLTFVQFAFVAGYCVVFLAIREQLSLFTSPSSYNGGYTGGQGSGALGQRRPSMGTTAGWGIKKPSRLIFHGTLMMSLFQIAGHVFSSMAIARVPVSTVHTIKALSPLFTVLSYAILFRVRYSLPTYIALGPLTLGVMLACSFDFRANAVGFLCALGSTVIFVSQNIFSKKLLPKENSGPTLTSSLGVPNSGVGASGQAPAAGASSAGKLDKLNLLFYSSGMAFFLMIPIWLYTDGSALLSVYLNGTVPLHSASYIPTETSSSGQLLISFLINGSVHFAQNLLAFSLLARTSPVTYSIASLVKRIAVICLAIIWSGQHVTLTQGLGMTLTFVGLWMYNRAKGDVDKGEKKRANVEKRGEMFLPTPAEELRAATVHQLHHSAPQLPPPPPLQQLFNSNNHIPVPPANNRHFHTSPTRQPPAPLSPHAQSSSTAVEKESGVTGTPQLQGGGVMSRKGGQGPPPPTAFGSEGGVGLAHR